MSGSVLSARLIIKKQPRANSGIEVRRILFFVIRANGRNLIATSWVAAYARQKNRHSVNLDKDITSVFAADRQSSALNS
jgi:hypothetical protein